MAEQEEKYGIDKANAHPKAVELIPEGFFWSCVDELAPFGSDEGATALEEYRAWRKANSHTPTLRCLKWVIESVGNMDFADYNQNIVDKNLIRSQIEDEDFDDQQYVYTLDISVIATGFAQLVDEGIIEQQNKPVIQLAIDRQKIWTELSDEGELLTEYTYNLKVLERALTHA